MRTAWRSACEGARQVALIFIAALCATTAASASESVTILQDGKFSAWTERRFLRKTAYETVRIGGRAALRATSDASASGLFLKTRIDLGRTPILRWSWRIDEPLDPINERTRGGDDYSARLYLVSRHAVAFWKASAVNYVWSSALPRGEAWPSAYARSVRMLAVRSGREQVGAWVEEHRDVRADFLRLLGKATRFIDTVAIMTDTDDSGGRAVAYYGDIRFTSE